MKQNIILHTPDGFNLDTIYYPGTNSIGIIFCHGLGWYKEGEEPFMKSAKELNKRGFSTLLFDFRANGKSSGDSVQDFTVSSQLIDIDTTVEFLEKNGSNDIYLAGTSFGAGAAILYAVDHQEIVTKLLLTNPTLDYDLSVIKHFIPQLEILEKRGFIEVHKEKFKLGRKIFNELKQFTPYKALEEYKNDLYIIHGDQDSRISHQQTIAYFEQLSNPKKKFSLIIGAGHGFHEEPFRTQVTELIINFFSK